MGDPHTVESCKAQCPVAPVAQTPNTPGETLDHTVCSDCHRGCTQQVDDCKSHLPKCQECQQEHGRCHASLTSPTDLFRALTGGPALGTEDPTCHADADRSEACQHCARDEGVCWTPAVETCQHDCNTYSCAPPPLGSLAVTPAQEHLRCVESCAGVPTCLHVCHAEEHVQTHLAAGTGCGTTPAGTQNSCHDACELAGQCDAACETCKNECDRDSNATHTDPAQDPLAQCHADCAANKVGDELVACERKCSEDHSPPPPALDGPHTTGPTLGPSPPENGGRNNPGTATASNN